MATATVRWGDGSQEQVEVTVDAGHWSIEGLEHDYAQPGSYTVTVTGTAGGSQTKRVTVPAAA